MRKWIALTLLLTACGSPDADGDGLSADRDCNDADATITEAPTWYLDADGDGFGVEAETTQSCTQPSDYVDQAGDCDDGSAAISPASIERCNEVDDNCDGSVDEGGAGGLWYSDADGDGYGDPSEPVSACDQLPGTLTDATDCDDGDAGVHPGATERCDGRDEDCDGQIDESAEDATRFYLDADGDGVGSSAWVEACSAPPGYVAAAGDCDDQDPWATPGSSERCDGVDNDCDGTVDEEAEDSSTWYTDADSDGFGDPESPQQACTQPEGSVADDTDCADGDERVNPETFWYPDGDGDGYGESGVGVLQQCERPAGHVLDPGDCADEDAEIFPGQLELCDGVDQDCDGEIDEGASGGSLWYVDSDNDGYGTDALVEEACVAPSPDHAAVGADCDDTRAEVNPGADEVCDGLDNDCDGLVDVADGSLVGIPIWYADADGDGYGRFEASVETCERPAGHAELAGDCADADAAIFPAAVELCDGVDNDCDTLVDGADAEDSQVWYVDMDGDGWGDPATELASCDPISGWVDLGGDCDDGDPESYPFAPETCGDAVDRNCDGSVGLVDADGDGIVACEDCDDAESTSFPGAVEVCDGVDNDCNGLVDDDGAGAFPWRWYVDEDADGYGLAYDYLDWCLVGSPEGYSALDGDCDDADPEVYPFAPERCNLEDDDCDGLVPAWEEDADGDGYGPLSCGGSDCDDAAAEINPGVEELCGDGIDNNCDGITGLDDLDGDFFGACDDCDDSNPFIHPYAWEATDGLDNDCDGAIDAADPDVATRLSTTDDSSHRLDLGFSFPFCGSTYTQVYAISNGRLTFGSGDTDYSETSSEMRSDRCIAGLWDDLNPGGGADGSVYWISYPDALGVYYRNVVELSTSNANTFSIVLLADGRVIVDIEDVRMSDGLSGWSCGTGGALELDLSALSAPAEALGYGQGTEEGIFEVFLSGNDLQDHAFTWCATAGSDADGDGWSDGCGDPDDDDPAITP